MKNITSEIGSTGLSRFGGYVTDEFLPELRGRDGMKRYREIRDNSAIVGAVFEAIAKIFRQFAFEWEPVDDTLRARKAAQLLNESFDDLDAPFPDTVQSNLEMLTFGFDIKERILKRRDGRAADPIRSSKYADGLVTYAAFAERAQESSDPTMPWEFSESGSRILAWNQWDSRGKRYRIPSENLLHFRTSRAKNNPEGRSALRNAWFSWFFFKRISEAEAIGISRDLTGIPVAQLPAEWFSDDALPWQKQIVEATRKMVVTVARGENEGILWPLAYEPGTSNVISKLELLSTGGRRQFDTSQIIERYERRMAMVFLADLILMGHEATGSYALSDNKTNILELAVKGHCQSIINVYQADAALIMNLNGWPEEKAPRLCAKAPRSFELGALGDFVSKMIAAGFKWNEDEKIEAALRDAADLPEFEPKAQAPAPPPPPESPDSSGPADIPPVE